jgi:hypothetical protein
MLGILNREKSGNTGPGSFAKASIMFYVEGLQCPIFSLPEGLLTELGETAYPQNFQEDAFF